MNNKTITQEDIRHIASLSDSAARCARKALAAAAKADDMAARSAAADAVVYATQAADIAYRLAAIVPK